MSNLKISCLATKAGALTAELSKTRVDFIKVLGWEFFIEIALSICTLRLRPTFTPVKASQKLGVALIIFSNKIEGVFMGPRSGGLNPEDRLNRKPEV